MAFEFHVEYGWSAPKIKDQFEKFDGLMTPPEKETERWQKIADALMMVALHSIIPPSQVDAGRTKLARRIEKWLVDNEYVVRADQATKELS